MKNQRLFAMTLILLLATTITIVGFEELENAANITMMNIFHFVFPITASPLESNKQPNHELKLIGAGFGRTGTSSTKIALESIGYGPTYHMSEVFRAGPEGHRRWKQVGQAKTKQERQQLLREILAPYQSTLDFPACTYWKDLVEMYPKAKVLLNVRDSAEQWVLSVKESIGMLAEFSTINSTSSLFSHGIILGPGIWMFLNINPIGRLIRDHLQYSFYWCYRRDPQEFMAVYDNWIQEINNTIPQDKLLIFNVKQGWKPLAPFLLGKHAPDGYPFPHMNDNEQMHMMMFVLSIVGWGTMIILLIFILMIGRCLI
jgi:hypothetical protein